MQIATTKPVKAAPEAMPQSKIMSTLVTFNRLAQAIDAWPKQTGIALDVDKLLNETVAAENHLRKLRAVLEEQTANRTVKQQLAQAQADLEKMVAKKLLLEPAEFAQEMHWTKQALSKALSANRVFYLEHKGQRYYPKFFADTHYERRQLEGVCQALGELPGASKWQFMSTPKGSLDGKTPFAALKAGMFSKVKVAAEGFVQR